MGFLLFFFTVLPLGAQPMPPQLEKLLALQKKPFQEWSEQERDDMPRMMAQISWEILLSEIPAEDREALRDVTVSIVSTEHLAPAWVKDRKIFLTEEAVLEMFFLGSCLGHDIYVSSGGEGDLPQPLFTHPFAASPLLPLLASVQGPPFNSYELLACPKGDLDCRVVQSTAVFGGIFGFVLAHEASHILLGHGENEKHSLDEELKADRRAWGMIQHLVDGPEAESDLGRDLRLAAFAGPFLLVRWQERPDNRDASAARRDQLDDLAGPDLAADASLLVDPAPVPGRLRTVRITWEEEPDAIYVNGERMAPAQLRGAGLRVFGTQRIFALRRGRFAFAELGWARRSSPSSPSSDTAALVFHAPQPTAGSPEDLRSLRKKRDWLALLLATATDDLRPRSPAVALLFYESLSKMGAGRLIDPSLPGLDRPSDRRTVLRWLREAQPLGRWRSAG
jgi:hypothetical protein